MKRNYTYLICTTDEYELALWACDTVKEVAELLGVKIETVHVAFYRTKTNICKVGGYQIEKVWMGDENSAEPIRRRSKIY